MSDYTILCNTVFSSEILKFALKKTLFIQKRLPQNGIILNDLGASQTKIIKCRHKDKA